jgi:hypothetical protein
VPIGASNLSKRAVNFHQAGFYVHDLTVPGWVASPDNISCVVTEIGNIENVSNYAFVTDQYGNSTFRYEQFDGTVSLLTKQVGNFTFAENSWLARQLSSKNC